MYDDHLEIINTGTLKIIDWCRENANPAPAWEEQSGSVVVTFRPAPGFTPQVTDEVPSEVARLFPRP